MPRFVIHRHAAGRLHYDLRLEEKGVLKSWAIPKTMPEAAGIKRLAVQVEDHHIDYIGFEGEIPEGQYGAGTVEIWDSGEYEKESWEEDKIVFILHGKRYKGRFALLRMRDKDWLVMKVKG